MLSFLCHCPTTFKIKNTRTTTRMSTATSTAAALPRPRGQSSSTTSKSKHQHNISEQCRQQIPFFPQSVSQATKNGRRGSNAWTFIALYLARSYHANIGHLPHPTQISPLWASVVMSYIILGNSIHDTLTGGKAILPSTFNSRS